MAGAPAMKADWGELKEGAHEEVEAPDPSTDYRSEDREGNESPPRIVS